MRNKIIIGILASFLGVAIGFVITGRIEIANLQADIANLETTVANLKGTNLELEAEIQVHKIELARSNEIITDQRTEIALKITQINSLESKITTLENKNSALLHDKIELRRQLEGATFNLGEDMLVLPTKSSGFDCDDSALYMYLYFRGMGYEVRIVAGNLDLVGESFEECDHVWVWVEDVFGGEISYDWGHVYDDKQHNVGYIITYEELLREAIKD